MILSHSKNFIFVHVEKTGGTSVEEFLTPFLDKADILFGGKTIGQQNANDYRQRFGNEWISDNWFWKHSSSQDIKKIIGENKWNQYYKFATVRDPQEIMISLYFFTKKNIDMYTKMFNLNNINNIFYDKDLNSELIIKDNNIITDDLQFLDLLKCTKDQTGINGFIKTSIYKERKVCLPQTTKLNNDVNLYDINFIDENWFNILNNLSIKTNKRLEIINKSNRDENYLLDDTTINLIKNFFKIDYDTIPHKTKTKWK